MKKYLTADLAEVLGMGAFVVGVGLLCGFAVALSLAGVCIILAANVNGGGKHAGSAKSD